MLGYFSIRVTSLLISLLLFLPIPSEAAPVTCADQRFGNTFKIICKVNDPKVVVDGIEINDGKCPSPVLSQNFDLLKNLTDNGFDLERAVSESKRLATLVGDARAEAMKKLITIISSEDKVEKSTALAIMYMMNDPTFYTYVSGNYFEFVSTCKEIESYSIEILNKNWAWNIRSNSFPVENKQISEECNSENRSACRGYWIVYGSYPNGDRWDMDKYGSDPVALKVEAQAKKVQSKLQECQIYSGLSNSSWISGFSPNLLIVNSRAHAEQNAAIRELQRAKACGVIGYVKFGTMQIPRAGED